MKCKLFSWLNIFSMFRREAEFIQKGDFAAAKKERWNIIIWLSCLVAIFIAFAIVVGGPSYSSMGVISVLVWFLFRDNYQHLKKIKTAEVEYYARKTANEAE